VFDRIFIIIGLLGVFAAAVIASGHITPVGETPYEIHFGVVALVYESETKFWQGITAFSVVMISLAAFCAPMLRGKRT
jgi:type IV secretory pathway VirB2 component (pilin)